MQSLNKKRIIIILVLFLLLIVGLILAFHKPQPKGQPSSSHVDPFSHQTVSNPPGKGPEAYGSNSNTPLFLGFESLLNYGLGSTQLQNLESTFNKYSQTQPKLIQQISVDVDHIETRHDPTKAHSPFEILFKVQFDGKSIYNADVQYTGINDVRLLLSDSSGKLIYDSGVIQPAE